MLLFNHLVVCGDLEEDILGYLFYLLLDYERLERIQKERVSIKPNDDGLKPTEHIGQLVTLDAVLNRSHKSLLPFLLLLNLSAGLALYLLPH